MFSVSLMRYNIEDFLNSRDGILVSEYRKYIGRFSKDMRAEIFETLARLPKDQLATLKLEYRPRNSGNYASLYIMTQQEKFSTYIIFKNDDYKPARYSV